MKNRYVPLFVAIIMLIGQSACTDECNDCLEVSSKRLKYLDSAGNNLLFGPQAIYSPDSVMVSSENGSDMAFWLEQDEGVIEFHIEPNTYTYWVYLSNTSIDTLSFVLADRKSTECCGNVTYTSRSFLNGEEISNGKNITIVQ